MASVGKSRRSRVGRRESPGRRGGREREREENLSSPASPTPPRRPPSRATDPRKWRQNTAGDEDEPGRRRKAIGKLGPKFRLGEQTHRVQGAPASRDSHVASPEAASLASNVFVTVHRSAAEHGGDVRGDAAQFAVEDIEGHRPRIVNESLCAVPCAVNVSNLRTKIN